MVGFIITGHGSFALGLMSAVDMIVGEQECIDVITFMEDEASSFSERLKSAVGDMLVKTEEVVIFCDLLGGTPFNQSMILSADSKDVRVVTGANLPMLIECISSRTSDMCAQDIVDIALDMGRAGIDSKVLVVDEDVDIAEDGI